ncbi:hypothetical protein [Mesorhizobium abyssinicae]|uniref:hypothetical protein n=1 Tax=Mesorhizobium abyssinicae TaxID=1209958 RepID=UPI0033987EB6
MDDKFYNRVGGDRISSRQIDELIGLARGLPADGSINKAEVESFKSGWPPMSRLAISRSSGPCTDGSMKSSRTACSISMNTPNFSIR